MIVDNEGIVPPPGNFKSFSGHQAAFCIGSIGFVAINNMKDGVELKVEVNVSIFCDS